MSRPRDRQSGFTLIELLVVIGIIAVLIGVTLSLGPRVLSGQKASATKNVLVSLDRMLDEYVDDTGSIPPYDPEDYAGVPGPRLTNFQNSEETGPEPYDTVEHVRFPAAGVFVNQVSAIPGTLPILSAVPSRFVASVQRERASGGPGPGDPPEPFISNILDAWGSSDGWQAPYYQLGTTLILYVHPRNALAQRLYGRCQNNRPYFMSAGPDRHYGTTAQFTETGAPEAGPSQMQRALKGLEDNIYSYEPQPADTSTSFNNQYR